MNSEIILKQFFGYDKFREGQPELIEALLSGRDALGVMPTGAGKSLCYQVPALCLHGVTLVISPLISLMRDQVQALAANGVAAAFINSSLNEAQWRRVMENARAGQYKIIYIAPERLMAQSMQELALALEISLIAVDEAHCISQWGQDFRPSYLDIPRFVQLLPTRPTVAAFTATATPRVRADILEALQLQNPLALVTGFDRPNLYFEVRAPQKKYAALAQYLEGNNGSGIVYCSTRKEVERVTAQLQADGYAAARYHAGLSSEERSRSQDDFLYDRVRIIVATNAFGMGIDKPDVRFVIHYNMPQNVESYYQEAGRAGRDALAADCILFYARKDVSTIIFLINQSENQEEIQRKRQLLQAMEGYCEADGCLRRYMLTYFGEETDEDCGNCGSCNGSFDETDVTVDAQKVLSHVMRLNKAGKRLAFTQMANILLGKSEELTALSTYGIMRGSTLRYLRRLSARLTALGYLYDDGRLTVTPKAGEVLREGRRITLRGVQEKQKRDAAAQYALSDTLFAKLKALRAELAREAGVPAFVVFSDATLLDMCLKHPRTEEEMRAVSGIGEVKLSRYGAKFLELLRAEEPQKSAAQELPMLTREEVLAQVTYSESPLQITRVADNISAALIRTGGAKISGMKLNKLLIEAGYLETTDAQKLPTARGLAIGISTRERQSSKGSYTQCMFSQEAQRVCAVLALQEEAQ